MAGWEARIAELGIELLGPLPAGGLYTAVVIDGDVAYTSGIVAVEGPPLHLVYDGDLSVVGPDSAQPLQMEGSGTLNQHAVAFRLKGDPLP